MNISLPFFDQNKLMNLIHNIAFIGMFCLGAFVAGIMNYGLSKIRDSDTFIKVCGAIVGAVFGGVIFIFIQYLDRQPDVKPSATIGNAVYMYPIGLLMSLLWFQVLNSIRNWIPHDTGKTVIAWLHFSFVSLLTIWLVILLFFCGKLAS